MHDALPGRTLLALLFPVFVVSVVASFVPCSEFDWATEEFDFPSV